MKKFVYFIIALCTAALFCCACNDSHGNNNSNSGNSYTVAHISGIKLYLEDEEKRLIKSDTDEYILSADSDYTIKINVYYKIRSAVEVFEKEAVKFEYDEEVISLVDRNPDDPFDYTYDIVCLKTDVPVTVSVKIDFIPFTDEITFKFAN